MTPQATEDGLILLEFLRTNLKHEVLIGRKLQAKLNIYRTLRDQLRFLLLQSSVLLLKLANLGFHDIRDQVNQLADTLLSRSKEGIKSN